MHSDSMAKTLFVALAVCVVCSVVVSTAAVVLKPIQEENKVNDRKRNILIAAGLIVAGEKPEEDIDTLFAKIDSRVVDLDTGEFVSDITPDEVDEKKALKTSDQHMKLSTKQDVAGIRKRENLRLVYFLRQDGDIKRIILPVRGRGLWSTMYGFIALSGDGNTVEAMEFYAHGETPGLGAEIDNAAWKASWLGKKVFDESGEIRLRVIKGKVVTDAEDAVFKIDGISGATITARGVTNLVHFWLGDQGYGPMLARLKEDNQAANKQPVGRGSRRAVLADSGSAGASPYRVLDTLGLDRKPVR